MTKERLFSISTSALNKKLFEFRFIQNCRYHVVSYFAGKKTLIAFVPTEMMIFLMEEDGNDDNKKAIALIHYMMQNDISELYL